MPETLPPELSQWQQIAPKLERLADRLLVGEVVFFVGAGFSVDSEGNSAERLLGRLFARFEGMVSALTKHGHDSNGTASKLRKTLYTTFSIRNEDNSELTAIQRPNQYHLKPLASQYYVFNDWIINAYSRLLSICCDCNERELAAKINKEENDLLENVFKDSCILSPIDWDHFKDKPKLTPAQKGKILFLETLGFANADIMSGCPNQTDIAEVVKSYKNKLLARHHVIARLAREGLCPTLITTNYDLLLEGAYRMAGFSFKQDQHSDDTPMAFSNNQHLVRVGEARHFFEHARTHRSAQLIKIHGCADRYREVRGMANWQTYLPSIVFTFREIQNWREDSWSRDLVSTLLRTRTLVFCGYSAADPVLHDTFRTVYEEIARRWCAAPTENELKDDDGDNAPAFAFGSANSRDFHVLEVLRAASQAIGISEPSLDDHPNYLPIHFRPKGLEDLQTPTSDHALLWLYHCTQRKLQARFLRRELISLLPSMLGTPAPASEIDSILAAFDKIYDMELKAPAAWNEQSTLAFLNVISWSWDFHPALLRELACSAATTRSMGTNYKIESQLRETWIIPASDRPDWSAWGVVLEIALRRVSAYMRKEQGDWVRASPGLAVTKDVHPCLIFTPDLANPVPLRLEIRLTVHTRPVRPSANLTGVAKQCTWSLPPGHLPWPKHASGQTPSASTLWAWACGQFTDKPELYLGALNQGSGP